MKKKYFQGIDPDRLKKEKETKEEPEPDCLKCADTGKVIVDSDMYGLIIESCPDCALGEQRMLDNAMFRRMFH